MEGSNALINCALIDAVRTGNLAKVVEQVNDHGLLYTSGWPRGYVLLCNAIQFNHYEIAKFLLEKGANVNTKKDKVDTPLHFAAACGNLDLVQTLINKNAAVNATNANKETPLHVAVENGREDIVELLVNEGASSVPNKSNFEPLHIACFKKSARIVELLLSRRTQLNGFLSLHVALVIASHTGCKQIVSLLLNVGVDPNFVLKSCYSKEFDFLRYGYTPLAAAIKGEHPDITELLLKEGALVNHLDLDVLVQSPSYRALSKALHIAAENGHLKTVEVLLNNGASVVSLNEKRLTPLLLAMKGEKKEVVKLLLDRRAQVEDKDGNFDTPLELAIKQRNWLIIHHILQFNPKTEGLWGSELSRELIVTIKESDNRSFKNRKFCGMLLHVAVFANIKRIVEQLLDLGVDVNSQDYNGSTPLHVASEKGHEGTVKILLQNKANVNALRKDKYTPLHIAALKGHGQIVKTLLSFGADVDAQGSANETPLHVAVMQRHVSTIRILIDNACDVNLEDSRGKTALDIALSEPRTSVFLRQFMMKRLIEQKVAGLYISRRIPLLRIRGTQNRLEEKCKEEVTRMKNESLCCHNTLHSVFVKRNHPTYARNETLTQALNARSYEEYPIYRSLLVTSFRNSIQRMELLTSAGKWLNFLIETSNKESILPIELAEEIVSYLNNNDAKRLISCGENLKRQLSR